MKDSILAAPKPTKISRLCAALAVCAVMLAGAGRCAAASSGQGFPGNTGGPPGPADENSFSIGVFQLTIDPAFTFLFNASPTYYYPGFDPTSAVLTSPMMYDFSSTYIGVSASHVRNVGSPTYFPVTVGATIPTPLDKVLSYSDYPAVPFAFALAPSGAPGVGIDEVFTEIEGFALNTGSSGIHCQDDPRVPAVATPVNMVVAGPNQIPGLPLNRRSLGMVQQLPADLAGTPPIQDFPARSFFDIFVEVTLPIVPGNASATDFPPNSGNAVPVGYQPGAILYNDPGNPLIIVNTNVTSLPPTAVYIHGVSAAVPMRFKFANPPYWNADDVIGYLVLAGHGVSLGASTNPCAVAQAVANTVLGPVGSPAPQLPIPWLRTNSLCPPPNSAYASVHNTVITPTATNALDDTVSFTIPAVGTIYVRDIIHSNLKNPIPLPAPNATSIYTGSNSVVQFQVSADGVNYFPGSASGNVVVSISNTNGPTGNATNMSTRMQSLNLSGSSPFGAIFLRLDPSQPTLGQHSVAPDPRGYRVSSFFDVFLQLSTDNVNWISANRSIRVQSSAPPAAPASLFPKPLVVGTSHQLILNWQGDFQLQSAPSVRGPFADVPGIFNGPYTNVLGTNMQFFRLRQ